MVPQAWINTLPSPSIFWRMNPSPPKKPAPSRLVKAMPSDVPYAAQRKESFWQIRVPSCSLRSATMILPG